MLPFSLGNSKNKTLNMADQGRSSAKDTRTKEKRAGGSEVKAGLKTCATILWFPLRNMHEYHSSAILSHL